MVLQNPTIGTRNISTQPRITVRMLDNLPPDINNIEPPVTPNELVAVFNGYDNTMNLYISSSNGRAYIPVTG